ncbi:hypothetical protein SAMN05421819_0745 [Bryocella elongata]|uniref:Uncharacterized protein n=2 Tax=Bryocella elongata TaxID=863522 RepID=A0A1H5TUC1_9BACT|nr:hypothetical protein SAMN05421819_0745 [Bryocella elongata]
MVRNTILATAAVALVGLGGCKSAFIGATVTNETGGNISEIEVDYPSASFGTSTLPVGGSYQYRFEVIGSGPLKATWTDSSRKPHSSTGPSLGEGLRGTVDVRLEPDGTAVWKTGLSH